jgi:hypothetical protein
MAAPVSLNFVEELEERALSTRRKAYFEKKYEKHVQEEKEENALTARRERYFRQGYQEQEAIHAHREEYACTLARELEEWDTEAWRESISSSSGCLSFWAPLGVQFYFYATPAFVVWIVVCPSSPWDVPSWHPTVEDMTYWNTPGKIGETYFFEGKMSGRFESPSLSPSPSPSQSSSSLSNDPLPTPPSHTTSTPQSLRKPTSSTALETLTSTLYTEISLIWNHYQVMYARTAPLYTDSAAALCSTDIFTLIHDYETSVANTDWAGRGLLMLKCVEWKYHVKRVKARAACGVDWPQTVLHPNEAVYAARWRLFTGALDSVVRGFGEEGRRAKVQTACEEVERKGKGKWGMRCLADELDGVVLDEDRALVEGWKGGVTGVGEEQGGEEG